MRTVSAALVLLAGCILSIASATWAGELEGKVRTLQGHKGSVLAVACAPDQHTLASVSVDLTVRLWDVPTGAAKQTLTGHTKRVKSVVYTPDGKLLATGSSDKSVRLWDAQTGKEMALLAGHTGGV